MHKLVELWYKIPRDREWWLDQFANLLKGCSTGCFTLFFCYAGSVVVSFLACLVFAAKNFSEALTMGLAWGSTLGMLVAVVFGSAVLAVISWWRGV